MTSSELSLLFSIFVLIFTIAVAIYVEKQRR